MNRNQVFRAERGTCIRFTRLAEIKHRPVLRPRLQIAARRQTREPALRPAAVIKQVILAVFNNERRLTSPVDIALIRPIAVTQDDACIVRIQTPCGRVTGHRWLHANYETNKGEEEKCREQLHR